jgi:hypothetical protein
MRCAICRADLAASTADLHGSQSAGAAAADEELVCMLHLAAPEARAARTILSSMISAGALGKVAIIRFWIWKDGHWTLVENERYLDENHCIYRQTGCRV